MKSFLFFLILLTTLSFSMDNPQPMKADFKNTASYRWLNKKVLETRLLDDMENPDNWITFTTGAQQIVDARIDAQSTESDRDITEMIITPEKSRDGRHSLRMRMPTKLNIRGPASGRGWGTAGVRRIFDNEDWTGSNRISIWIYPDCPGFYVNWLELRLYNDGVEKLPALFGQEGETSLLLRNYEWNHVVWEIGNVARDRITALEISYYMAGNEPDATDTATYYLDLLELQVVEPDHIEGWDVWPGRISFSHTGYLSGSVKTAIASGLGSDVFHVIDQGTGETVLTRPVENVITKLGEYQLLDFSEITTPGTYLLKSGNIRTGSFRINPDVWRETILKAMNFFYTERCGTAIPGVHETCHLDWRCIHNEKQILINGGWHDAGDLTQGLGNTAEAVYNMFSLAEHLQLREDDPVLLDRILEEAVWGLDWILKTSFRDGYRNGGSVSTRRTNGIIGDFDDVLSTARNSPMDHFIASAAEAIASRVLAKTDPRRSSFALEMAEEDWLFGLEGTRLPEPGSAGNMFRGNFDSDNVVHEIPSAGIMAAVDLWKMTKNPRYSEKAFEWAEVILASQQRTRTPWKIPMTGFFYTGPEKERILHYIHKGREHTPIQALRMLCENFQDNPDWIKWYSAIVMHGEYLKKIASYTAPYEVFPASIYNSREFLGAPESRQESFRNQVLQGIPLGNDHYLKHFPVWMDYRGHFGTILSQAQAAAWGGHLRNDQRSIELAQHQLEWVIGRNPFSQSTMWGEGYDYPPLYSVMSGDLVGGLPVGIQTKGDRDIPYWPVQNSWTYKEIWVYPVIRWIGLMPQMNGKALIEGFTDRPVTFTQTPSGLTSLIKPQPFTGSFRAMIPSGNYRISGDGGATERNFLPGGTYWLDLRAGQTIDFELDAVVSDPKKIRIKVTTKGSGLHFMEIRAANVNFSETRRNITLESGKSQSFYWHGNVIDSDMPWVVVVIPDQNYNSMKEIISPE